MKKLNNSTKRKSKKSKLQTGGLPFGFGKYANATPNAGLEIKNPQINPTPTAYNGTPLYTLSSEQQKEKKEEHNRLLEEMGKWTGGKRTSMRKTKSYKKTRKTVKK